MVRWIGSALGLAAGTAEIVWPPLVLKAVRRLRPHAPCRRLDPPGLQQPMALMGPTDSDPAKRLVVGLERLRSNGVGFERLRRRCNVLSVIQEASVYGLAEAGGIWSTIICIMGCIISMCFFIICWRCAMSAGIVPTPVHALRSLRLASGAHFAHHGHAVPHHLQVFGPHGVALVSAACAHHSFVHFVHGCHVRVHHRHLVSRRRPRHGGSGGNARRMRSRGVGRHLGAGR